MTNKEKHIKVIKTIRKKETEMLDKTIFCQDHNFKLEAEKFQYTEHILRRLASELQDLLDTGYVSDDE